MTWDEEPGTERIAPRPRPVWRTLFWLIRRELWEHRSIVIAPVAAAAFVVFAHFLTALAAPAAERAEGLAEPGAFQVLYAGATGAIVITGLIVGLLYSAEALKGERRDRSILFWKSLPVSDHLTVLTKVAIPLILLPLITLVLAVAAHLAMVALQSLAWQIRGADPRLLWAQLDLPYIWSALALGLPFMALWNAPLHAWLMMVSVWARSHALLWALAPAGAFLVIEHIVLNQTSVHWALERRIAGGILEPYTRTDLGVHGHTPEFAWIERLDQIDPGRLYTLPGLWIGVILAGVMLYAAARLRRSRPPL